MATLGDITSFLKSANAGATQITFDIGFHDLETLDRAAASEALKPVSIARLFGIDPATVEIYRYVPARVIKITIPRGGAFGGVDERDFDGTQQYPPLLDLEVGDIGGPGRERQ